MNRAEARQTNLELDELQRERAKGYDAAAHYIWYQMHEDPGVYSNQKVHDTLKLVANLLQQDAERLRRGIP